MIRCMVHVPFRDKETGKLYKAGKEIKLTEERVAEVKAFDVNLISELGEVKPKATSEE